MATTSERNRAQITKVMNDPRYWNKAHPDHARIFAESQRLFRDAYPEATPEKQAAPETVHVRAYTRVQDGKSIDVSAYDRRQEVAFHPLTLQKPSLPEYLQEIAEGSIHRRTKEELVQHLRAHGDTVETEVTLVALNGMRIRADILGRSPEGFRP